MDKLYDPPFPSLRAKINQGMTVHLSLFCYPRRLKSWYAASDCQHQGPLAEPSKAETASHEVFIGLAYLLRWISIRDISSWWYGQPAVIVFALNLLDIFDLISQERTSTWCHYFPHVRCSFTLEALGYPRDYFLWVSAGAVHRRREIFCVLVCRASPWRPSIVSRWSTSNCSQRHACFSCLLHVVPPSFWHNVYSLRCLFGAAFPTRISYRVASHVDGYVFCELNLSEPNARVFNGSCSCSGFRTIDVS